MVLLYLTKCVPHCNKVLLACRGGIVKGCNSCLICENSCHVPFTITSTSMRYVTAVLPWPVTVALSYIFSTQALLDMFLYIGAPVTFVIQLKRQYQLL